MNEPVAIVFDLDQTLFDRRQAMIGWLASLPLSEQQQQQVLQVDQNGYGNRDCFFREFETITGCALHQESLVQSLLQFAQFEPELLQRLQRLKERFAIAVLTNGASTSQRVKINALGLDRIFPEHCIFVSSEIGISKPDQRTFDWVADALGVTSHECVYFGDQLETDVMAARNAGWQAHLVQGPAEVIRWLEWLQELVY